MRTKARIWWRDKSRWGWPLGGASFAAALIMIAVWGCSSDTDEHRYTVTGLASTLSYHVNLSIGLVDGLTTAWHTAPTRTAVPRGTKLLFALSAPSETKIGWLSGEEVIRQTTGALVKQTVECPTEKVGLHVVRAEVSTADGARLVKVCSLEVVDIAIDDIKVNSPSGP